MQIQAILFDWGGTLAHVDKQVEALTRGATEVLQIVMGRSDADLVESMLAAAVEAEEQASQHPELREVDLGELIRDWARARGITVHQRHIEDSLEAIGRNWVGALSPVFGARDTLQTLRAMGLRIGLVSNCFIPPEYCWQELRSQGIDDLLDCAVFSSEIGHRKPSRRIYQAALRKMAEIGGPSDFSEILFVGDSPAYDVITPAALGMSTALVGTGSGLWSAEDYERAKPDFRVDSVTELPVLLADLS